MKVLIWFSFEGKNVQSILGCVWGGHARVLPTYSEPWGRWDVTSDPEKNKNKQDEIAYASQWTKQGKRWGIKCPGYAFPWKENKPRGLSLWRQVTEWISLGRVLTIFSHLFQILQKCIVKTENRKPIRWRFKWLSRCKSILGEIALVRIDKIGKQEEKWGA